MRFSSRRSGFGPNSNVHQLEQDSGNPADSLLAVIGVPDCQCITSQHTACTCDLCEGIAESRTSISKHTEPLICVNMRSTP